MKQQVLAVLLAVSIGVAFAVYSGLAAFAGDNCYRADAPSSNPP